MQETQNLISIFRYETFLIFNVPWLASINVTHQTKKTEKANVHVSATYF